MGSLRSIKSQDRPCVPKIKETAVTAPKLSTHITMFHGLGYAAGILPTLVGR
jgi:hypothetical protein